ncbi:Rho-type GTPase-activating protein 1 [Yarrowia sp. C11]|nr:Rho-type GTPase-activating protein 1 [Yarrowia sp. E02]KAG5372942.1 Rho-type GTPase-activating protein 1 [Yarrowia sp. C11]
MDSPESIVSSLDPEDNEVHFCKKCSKILEEGRAYELGGNRWHVECFRCSSCDSLLDGDTNLLVLGNGSLICANCSYHCYGCGKKIDDLAILTGDQAFCSSCFCCRNCKKKIEDLRYARTSQGIFCMTCHEALLAKKRKQKAARREREAREREALMNPSRRDSTDSKHSGDYPNTAEPPLHRTGTDESLRSHRHSFRPTIQRNNSSFKDKDLPQLPPKDTPPATAPAASTAPASGKNISRDSTPLENTGAKEESRPPPKPRQDSLQNLHNLKNTTSHESMRRQSYIQEIPLGLGDLEESEKRLSAVSNSTMPFLTPKQGGSDKDQSPKFEDAHRSQPIHDVMDSSSSADYMSTSPRARDEMHTQKSSSAAAKPPTESDKENQSPIGEGEGFISIGTEGVHSKDKEVARDEEPQHEESETTERSRESSSEAMSSSAASSPSPQREELESNVSSRSTDSGITVTPKVSPTKVSQGSSQQQKQQQQQQQPEEEDRSRHRALSHALHGTLSSVVQQPPGWQEVPERSHRRGQSPRPAGDQSRTSDSASSSSNNLNKNLTPEPSKHAGAAPFTPLSPRHDAHTNSANRSQQIVLDDDEEIDAAFYANNNYETPVPHTPRKRERVGSSSSTHSRAGSVFHKSVGTPGTPGRTAANAAPNQSMVTPSRSSPWHRRADSAGGPSNKDRLKTPDISLPILQASSAIDFDSELTGIISNPLSFNQSQFQHQKALSPTALGHQRSISDSHQSPLYQPSADHRRPSVTDEASISTALRNELVAAQKRIAALERQLQSGPSQPAPSAADHDSTLSEKRKTIAVLHAQGEVARRELASLNQAKGHDDPQAMIEEFTAQMAILKTQLQDEIASLSVAKEALAVEVEDLSRQKKEACEEMTILNVKNAQLTDLNNELINNLIDKYHPTHGSAMTNSSSTSKSAGGNLFGFKKDSSRSTPLAPAPAPAPRDEGGLGLSHIGSLIVQAYQPDDFTNGPPGSSVERVPVSTGSASSSSNHLPVGGGHTPAVTNLDDHEEPTVTVLEAGHVVDTKRDRQTARRFWKRPKATVTKNAVKGFTKVFEQPHGNDYPAVTNLEPSALSPSSSGQLEAGGLPHSASVNTGLNISFPTGKPTKARNGWFKGGNMSSTSQGASGTAGSPPDGEGSSLLKVSITRRCQLEGNKVPVIVTKCIEEVERRGMLQEGIYRKSGARTQIEQIEARFENYDERANYEEILSGDINGVASALKQYLRYLPDPLISASCYDAFIQVSSVPQDDAAKMDKMREVLQKLPSAHSLCLARLCTHLNRVTQHAEANLMSNKNLAMVFAPTLARATSGEREIADMHHKSDSTLFMIEHFKELF